MFSAINYFNSEGLDQEWFDTAYPIQIEKLIGFEKEDYHSNKYKKQDCIAIMVYLNQKLREANKREKNKQKNFKKNNRLIKVNSSKIQISDCSICFEKPSYNDMVTTECKHHFCRLCYDKWVINSIQTDNNINVTCPYCRKKNPRIDQYLVITNKVRNKP